MKIITIKPYIIISLMILSLCSLFATNKTYETEIQFNSENGLGSEYRKFVHPVTKLIIQRKYNEANELLDKAIIGFKNIIKHGDKTESYLCFQSKEEFTAYKKMHKKKIIWLDSSYGQAYHLKAFICVNQNNLKKAKQLLMIEKELAPMEAGVLNELGFISNREGKTTDALNYYKEALRLSKQFKSQTQWTGAALRGMGFTLIDLGKLEIAEECFNKSLKIEPNNKIALTELKYIKGLRDQKTE